MQEEIASRKDARCLLNAEFAARRIWAAFHIGVK